MLNSGSWMRRGRTIIIELGPDTAGSPEGEVTGEFESEHSTLRMGSRGSEVSDLQRRLSALRFSPGPVDGIFGSMTDAAVRAFQSSRRLTVDGIVGPQTWGALDAGSAPSPTPPPAPPVWGGGRAVHINVPFRGYRADEPTGCFNRCVEMANAVGVRVAGSNNIIQVAKAEDAAGRVTTIDREKARQGVAYIDSQLDAGHPVVVGVSYMRPTNPYNVDHITDHFVIITGRGTESGGKLFYGFHDPASSHDWIGADTNVANRFYLNSSGSLTRPASTATQIKAPYDLSMVRINI